jgi:hypothetical protein
LSWSLHKRQYNQPRGRQPGQQDRMVIGVRFTCGQFTSGFRNGSFWLGGKWEKGGGFVIPPTFPFTG